MEFNGNFLKSKVFVMECLKHHTFEKTAFVFQHFTNLEVHVGIKSAAVLKQLYTSDFHGCSSLFFVLEFKCRCRVEMLLYKIFKALKFNEKLAIITKVIVISDYQMMVCPKTNALLMRNLNSAKKMRYRFGTDDDFNNIVLDSEKRDANEKRGRKAERYRKRCVNQRRAEIKEYQTYLHTHTPDDIPNLIIMRCQSRGSIDGKDPIGNGWLPITSFWILITKSYGLQSIQEMANNEMLEGINAEKENTQFLCYTSTTTEGCYIFNINPALAIIINHISFIDKKKRVASQHDLERLKKTFASKMIPQLILKDGSASDVRCIMSEVQHTDFTGIKYLFVCVMSHGDEGDIIYTKSDVYNVHDDIIRPLMANESLKQGQIYVFVNACRGGFDPLVEDEAQPLTITNTDSMSENMVLFFSAIKGCVSLLESDGAIFMKKFCEIFNECFISRDMKEIAIKVEQELAQQWKAFKQVTDYCERPGSVHFITIQLQNLNRIKKFLEAFQNFAKCSLTQHEPPIEEGKVEACEC